MTNKLNFIIAMCCMWSELNEIFLTCHSKLNQNKWFCTWKTLTRRLLFISICLQIGCCVCLVSSESGSVKLVQVVVDGLTDFFLILFHHLFAILLFNLLVVLKDSRVDEHLVCYVIHENDDNNDEYVDGVPGSIFFASRKRIALKCNDDEVF